MTINQMMDYEVTRFLEYCHEICTCRNYAFYLEKNSDWDEERERRFQLGTIAGLFFENDSLLINLLNKHCNHNELKYLLEKYRDEQLNSPMAHLVEGINLEYQYPEVKEPLIKWIYEVNYLLAYPIVGDSICKNVTEFTENQEKILSFAYLNLKHKEYERKHLTSLFSQEKIQSLYNGIFDKNSTYRKYGLIPLDAERILYSNDEPVRIYDHQIEKTIFLQIPRPLAKVLQKLVEEKFINNIAFRGDDRFIYDGENHCSSLMEAVETGKIFDLDITSLPRMSKLISDHSYADSLWITVDEGNVTFEELCKDLTHEGDSIVTQMVHLQYVGKNITHIDHEYIFYSLDEYEKRKYARVKGESRKRFKTFKADKATIPLDYECPMFLSDGKEISVPFIYFVLNAYFVHKDLLREYFRKIISSC